MSATRAKTLKRRQKEGFADRYAEVGGPVLEALPPRSTVLQQVAAFLPFLNRVDRNQDGVITAEELRDFLEEDDPDDPVLTDGQLLVMSEELTAAEPDPEPEPEPDPPPDDKTAEGETSTE
jgi:hypothetical protein